MSANQTIALAFRGLCVGEGESPTDDETYNSWMPEEEAADWLRRIAAGTVHLGVSSFDGMRHPALFE